MISLSKYKNIIFDCDGVILNSNKIKSNAFYEVALNYTDESGAKKLFDYHIERGGMSRFAKFKWFIETFLKEASVTAEELAKQYSQIVFEKLNECELAEGILELREITSESDWMVISGGAEEELRRVFESRGLLKLFNRGIYGSPDTKYDLFRREVVEQGHAKHSVYLCDSKYDIDVCTSFSIDFIFVSEWSEYNSHIFDERINENMMIRRLAQLCL